MGAPVTVRRSMERAASPGGAAERQAASYGRIMRPQAAPANTTGQLARLPPHEGDVRPA
jgi:hypothetical protein